MENINQIIFDKYATLQFSIVEQVQKITLEISDSLRVRNEILTDDYKNRLLEFIKSSKDWYPLAVQAVRRWGSEIYGTSDGNIQLITVFVRFEQNDTSEIFGLEFRADFDVEHGCGMKIDGTTFEIIEIGLADIAFC